MIHRNGDSNMTQFEFLQSLSNDQFDELMNWPEGTILSEIIINYCKAKFPNIELLPIQN
jgi:hypothetical protein